MTVPAGHQPFSDQRHHIANQYLFWLAKLINVRAINYLQKSSISKNS